MNEQLLELGQSWLSGALGLEERFTPFPWQLRLLRDFLNGRIWTALDLPTGLGKTSVMAIWLVARALGAKLPRRLVYVVDRRAVVDQATDVALALRAFVKRDLNIAEHLGILDGFLPVSTLRGQYVDNREWLDDPSVPAIIVGTVDMIGSRLLFQGYGVSRKMRPFHAGLLGSDTLVVLDEAHLVPVFERMLQDIASGTDLFGPKDESLRAMIPAFKMLSLSATGRRGNGENAFRLSREDLQHPEINARLSAPKRISIRELPDNTTLADKLAIEAWKLAGTGSKNIRCLVYSDKREDAMKSREKLASLAREDKRTGRPTVEIPTDLFVGGRRVFERQDAAESLRALGFIAGTALELKRPTFLFATSAAEVGVDLDSDCMVCDLVTWERMVQRLGRVNRRGQVQGGADVVVIVKPDPKPDKRNQEALEKRREDRDERENRSIEKHKADIAWQRALREPLGLLCWNGGTADGSTGALLELNGRAAECPEKKRVLDAATTPEPLRPALTASVIGAWSLTSLEVDPGRPDIEPWLRGWLDNDPPQTQIAWRTHLPVGDRASPVSMAGTKKEIEAFFEAAPPHKSEILETDTFRVLDWLAARAKGLLNVHVNRPNMSTDGFRDDSVVAIVLSGNGRVRKVLRIEDLRQDKDGRRGLLSLLAGATVIVDARIGGLRSGLLENKEAIPPRTVDDGGPWMQDASGGVSKEPPVVRFRVRSVRDGERSLPDPEWRERLRFAVDLSAGGEPSRWLIVEKWRFDAANEEDRSTSGIQLLEDHRIWAEDRARAQAKSFNLSEEYTEMLATAAFLHDEGKRTQRWQRAFNAPDKTQTWAKTEGPINFALLDGYRHELGSIMMVGSHARIQLLREDLRDLALHLIAAHHGFARPFIETRGCDTAPPSVLEPYAKTIALRFARLHQQWGAWGLAWWESLLRASDQQASRANYGRISAAVAQESEGC